MSDKRGGQRVCNHDEGNVIDEDGDENDDV